MGDFADRFGDIVRGLISLEVNTIVKEGMSATRMPAPDVAMCEIATRYATWLQNHGRQPLTPSPPVKKEDFDSLASEAAAVRKLPGVTEGIAVMSTRIERSSRHLSSIYGKLVDQKAGPDPDELVQLRKIWEIGTEEVVVQTVVWIDGDAVQRIHPAYADKSHEQLLAIHAASVGVSLSYWKSLGELLVSLFNTVWTKLTGK